jgi:transcription elongation factor GreB
VSKAFTKEDGAAEPRVVPSRAPLPAGVPNYVTPRGLACLRAELASLTAEQVRLADQDALHDDERKAQLSVVAARIKELSGRIGSAVVVEPHGPPPSEVRFGVRATVRSAGQEPSEPARRYTIVGVDEADAATGRIAFVAPVARALLGLRAGQTATVRTGRREEELEIVAIEHEPLYKIAGGAAWADAQRTGTLAASAADERDGYVHLSAADQVRATAARHFTGQRELVLLTVDPARLPAGTLRWEPSRGGLPFPHLYTALGPGHVSRADPLPVAPDGTHVFPPSV